MYAIEFETDITSRYLELKEFDRLQNKHARVIILVEEGSPEADAADNLAEFRALQARRSEKRKMAKELSIESMEDDINNDIF